MTTKSVFGAAKPSSNGLSPPAAVEVRQECPVLFGSGAPEGIRTSDLCLRRQVNAKHTSRLRQRKLSNVEKGLAVGLDKSQDLETG